MAQYASYTGYTGGSGGGGGGGTPGGSNGQVQYNNGGNFGGFGSWNGTTLAITGAISSTTTMAVGTNLHVFGTSIMAGDMVVQGGANFSGNLGFYGASEVSQPSGNIFTALTNLGLVTSPSLGISNITGTTNSTITTLSALSLPYSQITGAPSGGITALTGDGTASGPGSAAFTLATVNSNVGSFGSSTAIPSFTVNGKGLVTAASTNAVIAPAGTLTGTTLNPTVVTSSLTSLGTQSVALNMGSHLINAVTDPVSAQDAATKNYVDTVASGLQPIQAAYAATAGSNVAGTYVNGAAGVGATFTTTSTTTFTVDGVTPPLASRVLLKDQTSGFQNGVYNVTQIATGVLPTIFTRSLDYDTAGDVNAGDLIPIINGTINAQTSWLQTATVVTMGTDPLVFTQWTANPASYLLKANNLSDVANKATSFNNLSPMTTGGDIIYGGASGTGTRLANGSAGQVLTSNGTTLAPSWQTAGAGAAVTASYYASANGTTSPTQTINFDTKIYDTNNAVTASAAGTGSWKFTAPITGYYQIGGQTVGSGNNSGFLFINGSNYAQVSFMDNLSGTGTMSYTIFLNATDFFDIRSAGTMTYGGNTLSSNNSTCKITINLVK